MDKSVISRFECLEDTFEHVYYNASLYLHVKLDVVTKARSAFNPLWFVMPLKMFVHM
jgi:hypothetical protein